MADKGKTWEPLAFNTEGLRGRVAKILVDDPVNSGFNPADLPPGTTEVVLVDDTPNINLDLAVHPVGKPEEITYIHYDELAVETASA